MNADTSTNANASMNASATPALTPAFEAQGLRAYKVPGASATVETIIATTPETRAICNDPDVRGVDYTRRLQAACSRILKHMPGRAFGEAEAVVVNILRGGLNFGLRGAVADAFGWNRHTTCFISAQRARDAASPEDWHITENDYKKLYFPPVAAFLLGDIVATGTSLRYGMSELVSAAQRIGTDLRTFIFFTIGGMKTVEIFSKLDAQCRQIFPNYKKTTVVFLEGIFTVAEIQTPLTIRLTGTDLVRLGALMAPEFVESQYASPAYPIERCAIYDAGSRAFHLDEYESDVAGYWKQTLKLAERGMTFEALVRERFPELDPARFGDVDLKELSLAQIAKFETL